jgi:hypothetical protein
MHPTGKPAGLSPERPTVAAEPAAYLTRQTPRVVISGHRVIGAHLATVEGMSSDQVALQLLPAAVADHQTRQRVTRTLGPSHPAVGPAPCRRDSFGAGVGGKESRHLVPCDLIHNGFIGLDRGGDPIIPVLPLLASDVAEGRDVRVEEEVRLFGATRHVKPEVSRVGQDGTNCRHRPRMTRSMGVPDPVVSGWTRYPFIAEHCGDLLVARACKVEIKDPPHDGRRQRVGGELVKPGAGGGLGWIRVGSEVGDQVTVRGTTTEPPTRLSVSSNGVFDAKPGSVALGPTHGAVVGEGHVVPVVIDIHGATQLRHPQPDSVMGELEQDALELRTRECPLRLGDDQGIPPPVVIFQVGKNS